MTKRLVSVGVLTTNHQRHWTHRSQKYWLFLPLAFAAIMFAQSTPTQAQCPLSWESEQIIQAGTRPGAIASEDFNGDGEPDLVVSSFDNNNVKILIGNGDGTFSQQAANYNVGFNRPTDVVIADFNHDTKQDIAVSNRDASNVVILLGNGNGTFQSPPIAYSTGATYRPIAMVVADFNHDSRKDLVVINDNGIIATLMGRNNNSTTLFFGADLRLTVDGAASVAVNDFDQDGELDLAVVRNGVCCYQHNVAILFGNGTGNFTPFSESNDYAVDGNDSFAIAADLFNTDAYPDLAIANYNSNSVTVLLNNGSGGFPDSLPPSPYSTGASTHPSDLIIADVNGDGKNDIIAANSDQNSVKILRGIGDGTFASAGTPAMGNNLSSILVLNLDGVLGLDIVAGNNASGANSVSVKLNASSLPEITQQPSDQIAYNGYAAHLSISVTDVTSYQWRRDGVNQLNGSGVSGATTANLTINPISGGDFGVPFDCIVTNTCGSVTSNSATITVLHDCAGDMNHDGNFDGLDITNFVDELLSGNECPK